MKIKLAKINNIDKNDILKRVEYIYSISDSSGQLKIEQSMYNNMDELEYFITSIIPNLYKCNIETTYTIYYKNYKYMYKPSGTINKIKMY